MENSYKEVLEEVDHLVARRVSNVSFVRRENVSK